MFSGRIPKAFMVLLSVTLLMIAGLMAPTPAQAQAKPIKLRLASPFPTGIIFHEFTKDWVNKIKNDTAGRLEFDEYWAGTLVPPGDSYKELTRGVADVVFLWIAVEKSGFDLDQAMPDFFYGARNAQTELRVYQDLWAKFPEIRAQYKDVKLLSMIYHPGFVIATKQPVRTLADLKGKRLRCIAGHVNALKALGAEPVVMSNTDAYFAIQKGVLDGGVMPHENLQTFKVAEITKYYTECPLKHGVLGGLAINQAAWNKLPPDIQKILDDNVKWANERTLYWFTDVFNVKAIDFAKKQGGEFIKLAPEEEQKFSELLKSVALERATTLDAKGLPGTNIFKEARVLIEKYNK
jgi:TRAP-type C4-dicarboxylate transport system substrate-binding protein